jgi:DNA sulfur modification protein DndB
MAKKVSFPPISLPCLRGKFGNWIYYSCTLPFGEVVGRVRFAEEIHKSKALSDLIQRQLSGERAKRIADYLVGSDDRFFNSLVLATYGGDPQWYEIGDLSSSDNAAVLASAPTGIFDTLGILRLAGSEQIFALDGQHRLAGMRKALEKARELAEDLVPVILVGHAKTATGEKRTRRLFTTLNKTAIAVKKADIIALDEDDVMAITARYLVEEDRGFKDPKTAVISSESMPSNNMTALLTISGLYDILKQVIRPIAKSKYPRDTDFHMRFNRPDDDELDKYRQACLQYFNGMGRAFKPVGEFLSAADTSAVVRKYRTANGGHVLFRTIGVDLFTRVAVAIAKRDGIGLPAAATKLAKLPTRIDQAPYRGIIWDPARKTIKPANKPLMARLLFYMLGLPLTPRQASALPGDYRAALGHERSDTSVKLPKKL